MDNPYHHPEEKRHHLDRELARVQCFDAFNIVSAGRGLGDGFEDGDDNPRDSSLFRLHHRLAEPRLSQLLLALSVFVRTFDDLFRDSLISEAYLAHAAATDGKDYIGDLDGEALTLRGACNKIIHATDFRPVYDHLDRENKAGVEERFWYMTGEIEIEGSAHGRTWNVLLFVPQFLETVLDRIDFDG